MMKRLKKIGRKKKKKVSLEHKVLIEPESPPETSLDESQSEENYITSEMITNILQNSTQKLNDDLLDTISDFSTIIHNDFDQQLKSICSRLDKIESCLRIQ